MSNTSIRDRDRTGDDLIARIDELTPPSRMAEESSGIGWRSLLAAARLEIQRLRSALKPFADQAAIIDETDIALDVQWFRFRGSITAITVGDCRKAAAMIAGEPLPATCSTCGKADCDSIVIPFGGECSKRSGEQQ